MPRIKVEKIKDIREVEITRSNFELALEVTLRFFYVLFNKLKGLIKNIKK